MCENNKARIYILESYKRVCCVRCNIKIGRNVLIDSLYSVFELKANSQPGSHFLRKFDNGIFYFKMSG